MPYGRRAGENATFYKRKQRVVVVDSGCVGQAL